MHVSKRILTGTHDVVVVVVTPGRRRDTTGYDDFVTGGLFTETRESRDHQLAQTRREIVRRPLGMTFIAGFASDFVDRSRVASAYRYLLRLCAQCADGSYTRSPPELTLANKEARRCRVLRSNPLVRSEKRDFYQIIL